ncbi:hypothetical protein E9840_07685 [Tissierella creatinini]|nr:hypothetical protein E9840_07685 [Tissierella creatinini]TJX61549.1 hypothetical protein E8P77_18220 [Soehngenia saccharolytica]
MKIAYLVTVYKNPTQVNFLLSQLLEDPDADIFIHIDKKNLHVKDSLLIHPNIYILDDSFEVHWGAFGMTSAMLLLLKKALESNKKYDYFSFRTGQDLMVKKGFNNYLSENNGRIFMKTGVISRDNPTYSHIAIKWPEVTKKLYDGIQLGRIVRSVLIKLYSRGINLLPSQIELKYDYKLYHGGNWFTIPHEAAYYIIDFLNQNQWYFEVFKNSLVPDEKFFQTIIMNSTFSNRIINDNLTYIGKLAKNHPPTLTRQEISEIEDSNKFFARKFDMNVDEEVIRYFINKVSSKS